MLGSVPCTRKMFDGAIELTGAIATNDYRQTASNSRNALLHSSGGRKWELKPLTGLALSEGRERESAGAPAPAPPSPAALGWRLRPSALRLCPSSPSCRDPGMALRARPSPVRSWPVLLTSAEPIPKSGPVHRDWARTGAHPPGECDPPNDRTLHRSTAAKPHLAV